MSNICINVDKLSTIILEDDNTDKGGVSFSGETLTDFLFEIGKEDKIPNTFSNEWLQSINAMLVECGIKTISL